MRFGLENLGIISVFRDLEIISCKKWEVTREISIFHYNSQELRSLGIISVFRDFNRFIG